jgi:PAS domain S-box-containing protein
MIDIYLYVLVAGLVVLVFQMIRLWSLRRAPGAAELLLFSIACGVWSVGYALEIFVPGLAHKLLWARIQYLGIPTVGVWYLLFMLRYTGRITRVSLHLLAVLLFIPVLTVIIVFSNEVGTWMWVSVALQPEWNQAPLTIQHGWWFWVHSVYSYSLLLATTVILVQFIFKAQRRYLSQLLIMLAALMVPWIGNFLFIVGFQPGPHLDFTPIAFIFTNIGLTIGFVRYKMFDIRPIAYSSIFAFMRDGVIVVDPLHRIIDINPAARKIFGRFTLSMPPEKAWHSDVHDPLIGRDVGELLPNWLAAADNGNEAVTIRGPESETQFFSLRTTPMTDEHGHPTGHILILTDVTSQRRAEEWMRLQALALESAENAIMIFNSQARIEWINPAFTHLTGFEREDVLGNNSWLLHLQYQKDEQWQAIWDAISTGAVWRGETVNRRKDGSLCDEETTITPLVQPDGTIPYFIAIIQDISARKHAEEALKLAHEQAVASNRSMTQLLTNVSHDMRTPLNAIIVSAERLQTGDPVAGPPDRERTLLDIQDDAHQLLLFVDNLLGQSQFETGRVCVRPRPFCAQELVDACQAGLQIAAEKKGLRLEYEIEPPLDQPLLGDPDWLRQILLNLVSNAVRFTRHGLVKVRLFCPDPQHWAIEVVDTGIGIPRDLQERIYKPFYQGTQSEETGTPRDIAGFGLGLAIVRELSELMDGRVDLVSWPGIGSTFTVILPYGTEGG